MAASSRQGATLEKAVGIVDIGSNSLRMVVFDGRARIPVPVFNEKATCALGRGMTASGRLNPEGVEMAYTAIGRFVRLSQAMALERLDLLATAAVRDAEDGPAFVKEVKRRFGVDIRVLSGGEEAEYAALGVLSSTPAADGLVADLGGGSLELVNVGDGRLGDHVTLPLGVLRLEDDSSGSRWQALSLIDRRLSGVSFLDKGRGRSLYAVGGAWRALARICIDQLNYPLHVLDNFTLPASEAEGLIDLISKLSRPSLEKIPGVAKKRLSTLPLAALLLERLIQTVRPDKLVFSVHGMREGAFFRGLDFERRDEDPLIAACSWMAQSAGRFPEHCDELMNWMAPLFPDEPAHLRRLRRAGCLLSDIFWNEHPDYRAEQAFLKVLRLPLMGLEHTDRTGLALATYYRYASSDHPLVAQAETMLDMDRVDRVRAIGFALRLGHTISGGAPSLLKRTRLYRDGGLLTLEVPGDDDAFAPNMFDKRFEKLGRVLRMQTRLVRV